MFKKRTLLFYLVILMFIVLVTGGCGKKSEPQATNDQKQVQEAKKVSGDYSINQLLMMKKPLKCTWNEEETGAGKVSNVMYINGEKFYQDVTVGEMGHSYALNDGEYIYTWNDFNSQATKVSIKLAEKSSTVMTNRENSDGYGLEQRRTFTCEEWSVDNNIFVLPLDKDFKDMNEQVEQTVNKMEQEADAYKQVCDMCTRASTKQLRDDCAKKFGCN